jgi:uncharacterized membrane protein
LTRPTPAAAPEALESQIGSRWLLYVGVIAIVIGVSYFEKLAIENHWVNETWRTIQGGIAGVLFVIGGLRIVRKGYRLYGQILAGTGVALMYVSTYAAFNFYHLLTHPIAFLLMLAITALAGWLADSQRSQGLALHVRLNPDWRDDAPRAPARVARAQRRQLRVHGAHIPVLGRGVLSAFEIPHD